ncbi:hypothetical protein [Marinobacterium litorale]|uniref:hypothetical protein n=1 Tax=Marinobacterium litorale TaxID=404770 RepID=UPI0003F55035|nr:hypothetical protein [Marinobacterium litorale]
MLNILKKSPMPVANTLSALSLGIPDDVGLHVRRGVITATVGNEILQLENQPHELAADLEMIQRFINRRISHVR